MTANAFWNYVNDVKAHLICSRARWTRIDKWLMYVSSVNFSDYTVAKEGFDAIINDVM